MIPCAPCTFSMTKLLIAFQHQGMHWFSTNWLILCQTLLFSFWLMSQTTWSVRRTGSASNNTLQLGDKSSAPLERWARLYTLKRKKLCWAEGHWSLEVVLESKRSMQTHTERRIVIMVVVLQTQLRLSDLDIALTCRSTKGKYECKGTSVHKPAPAWAHY